LRVLVVMVVSPALQVQDTIPICPSQLSQHVALAALEEGGSYIQQQIADLRHNRAVIADALTPLGSKGHGWIGGEGAIYFFAKLPDRFSRNSSSSSSAEFVGKHRKHTDGDSKLSLLAAGSDEAVVEWLIQEHGVCVIPGSACGAPGYVRVAFANLQLAQCEVAAARLKGGLHQLVSMANCVTMAA